MWNTTDLNHSTSKDASRLKSLDDRAVVSHISRKTSAHPESVVRTYSYSDAVSSDRSIVEICGSVTCGARSHLHPDKFRNTSGYIPVGHVNIGILIDMASVGRAKVCGGNITGKQFVIRPLVLVRIVT